MLLSNSNGHNFFLRGLIQANNISRSTKLDNGSSQQIQMVITFQRRSDSGTSYVEMLEIEQRKLSRNSNGHDFSLGGPIQAHNKSRRSKLNNGCYSAFQMVITFDTVVLFKRIIYRDTPNLTTEALNKFKWS